MSFSCMCPTCGNIHFVERAVDPEVEQIPLVQPTVHCPICWTYGHVHRKDCKYSEAGMIHHVPL